ncbi:hypothetical protein HPB50_019627 [Hyalomma asiaticum]|uniref:Uncharacterized protein n=1 Tax=Hyalomma asiaticum TaxID=266040 RepID=A0ACB7RT14_HYAAI|nr:hypothetical protein HPB50_019627 [Hyalomma asiaticum]
MDDHRWARRMFCYLHFVGLRTQWLNRVYFLRPKHGMLDHSTHENTERKFTAVVRKRIREEESAQWQISLQQKSTLQLYRTYKETIGPESLYNSGGSGLLFEACAGALRTLTYRSRFDPSIDSTLCRACGAEQETVEHLVLQCQKLSPRPPEATTLPQALALTDRNEKLVATTKTRLQQWWKWC